MEVASNQRGAELQRPSPWVYAGMRLPQDLDPGIPAPWQSMVDIPTHKRFYWNMVTNVTTQVRPVFGAVEDKTARPVLSIDRTFMRRQRMDFYCMHELRLMHMEMNAYVLLTWEVAYPNMPGLRDDEEESYFSWLGELTMKLQSACFWEHMMPRSLSWGLYKPCTRWSAATRICPLPVEDCLSFSCDLYGNSPWVREGDVFQSQLVLPSELAAGRQLGGKLNTLAAAAPSVPPALTKQDTGGSDSSCGLTARSQASEGDCTPELAPMLQSSSMHTAGLPATSSEPEQQEPDQQSQEPDRHSQPQQQQELDLKLELKQQHSPTKHGCMPWGISWGLKKRKGHKK